MSPKRVSQLLLLDLLVHKDWRALRLLDCHSGKIGFRFE